MNEPLKPFAVVRGPVQDLDEKTWHVYVDSGGEVNTDEPFLCYCIYSGDEDEAWKRHAAMREILRRHRLMVLNEGKDADDRNMTNLWTIHCPHCLVGMHFDPSNPYGTIYPEETKEVADFISSHHNECGEELVVDRGAALPESVKDLTICSIGKDADDRTTPDTP